MNQSNHNQKNQTMQAYLNGQNKNIQPIAKSKIDLKPKFNSNVWIKLNLGWKLVTVLEFFTTKLWLSHVFYHEFFHYCHFMVSRRNWWLIIILAALKIYYSKLFHAFSVFHFTLFFMKRLTYYGPSSCLIGYYLIWAISIHDIIICNRYQSETLGKPQYLHVYFFLWYQKVCTDILYGTIVLTTLYLKDLFPSMTKSFTFFYQSIHLSKYGTNYKVYLLHNRI